MSVQVRKYRARVKLLHSLELVVTVAESCAPLSVFNREVGLPSAPHRPSGGVRRSLINLYYKSDSVFGPFGSIVPPAEANMTSKMPSPGTASVPVTRQGRRCIHDRSRVGQTSRRVAPRRVVDIRSCIRSFSSPNEFVAPQRAPYRHGVAPLRRRWPFWRVGRLAVSMRRRRSGFRGLFPSRGI